MEDWVQRALARWPNVPALFGWLGLDRRGRWLIKGEPITRPQIIDTINRNYASDEHGRWFFQNGPQRGYVALHYAPLVLAASGTDGADLCSHTGERVSRIDAVFLDEEGSLLLSTDLGPGLLADSELAWALARLQTDDGPVTEEALAAALACPSGSHTALKFTHAGISTSLRRLDQASAPGHLGFVREPQPDPAAETTCGSVNAPSTH